MLYIRRTEDYLKLDAIRDVIELPMDFRLGYASTYIVFRIDKSRVAGRINRCSESIVFTRTDELGVTHKTSAWHGVKVSAKKNLRYTVERTDRNS